MICYIIVLYDLAVSKNPYIMCCAAFSRGKGALVWLAVQKAKHAFDKKYVYLYTDGATIVKASNAQMAPLPI